MAYHEERVLKTCQTLSDQLHFVESHQEGTDASMQGAYWFMKNRRETSGRISLNTLVTQQATSV